MLECSLTNLICPIGNFSSEFNSFFKKTFSVIFHIFLVVYRNRNTDRNAFIFLLVIFERTRFPRPVIFRGLLGQRGMLMTFLKSFFCSRAPSHFTITDKFSSTMAELRSFLCLSELEDIHKNIRPVFSGSLTSLFHQG